MIPSGLIKEFIGNVCVIKVFNEADITGKIEAVEENWLKITEKGISRLVNGDMIRDIKMKPEKAKK